MTTVDNAASRSQSVFPGGSNGEFNLTDELSCVIARGEGCRLWDTSGGEFQDFSMGWGSALVGHARAEVAAAVQAQAPNGSNYAYVNAQSLALGEELVRLSPACEQVRFCASGTEATMYCQRLARAHTGRSKILKFEGAYHGANDVGVISLFPQQLLDFPQPNSSSAGLDRASVDNVLVAPFNDRETTQRIMDEHASELAAVIMEPLHRCCPPEDGFLASVREQCTRHGVLLIFDEVVTGFRLAYGGAQEYYGVVPDLVAYGKALGGGYPIGAFGGPAAIMDIVRESRMNNDTYVWMASTLGGNPISCAAALATLEVFRAPGVYERLHALGHYLREGMRRTLADAGEVARVIGDGPLAQVVFTSDPVTNYRDGMKADRARGRSLMLELFARGIFLNPMGTKLYLSMAHDESICDEFLARFRAALDETR